MELGVVGAPPASAASFPPGLAGAGAGADSGGPAVFRNPISIFSPAAPNSRRLNFANNNILSRSYKMEGAGMHDLEAQEAMARDFQPALEVGYVSRYVPDTTRYFVCIPTELTCCRVR